MTKPVGSELARDSPGMTVSAGPTAPEEGSSLQSLSSLLDRLARERGVLIQPGRAEAHYWRDLWHYRELMMLLAWRDISVRYRQTLLGVLWAVIQPLVSVAVLTFAFGRVAGLESGNVPYAILVYTGLLPWHFFANALGGAANSLVVNANLLGKVYFPRMIVPAASIAVCLVDFLVSAGVLALLMAWYGVMPSYHIVLLPFLVLLLCVLAWGLGLLLVTWNVWYRDFRYVVPFMLQLGLFLSPVGYGTSSVPEHWRLLYSLNPMVGIIDGFRLAILGGGSGFEVPGFLLSLVLTVLILILGISCFRRMERQFADVI